MVMLAAGGAAPPLQHTAGRVLVLQVAGSAEQAPTALTVDLRAQAPQVANYQHLLLLWRLLKLLMLPPVSQRCGCQQQQQQQHLSPTAAKKPRATMAATAAAAAGVADDPTLQAGVL